MSSRLTYDFCWLHLALIVSSVEAKLVTLCPPVLAELYLSVSDHKYAGGSLRFTSGFSLVNELPFCLVCASRSLGFRHSFKGFPVQFDVVLAACLRSTHILMSAPIGLQLLDISCMVPKALAVHDFTGVLNEDALEAFTRSADSAAMVSREIVQSLATLWPSLPALLLAGAVQRLCHITHAQHQSGAKHPIALLGWVKVLLAKPIMQEEQRAQTSSRGSKRKSVNSDAKASAAAAASDHTAYMPTAAQLKASAEDCLTALPKADGETAAALQKVLLLLLGQVKQHHGNDYVLWGSTAERLTDLCCPAEQCDRINLDIGAISKQKETETNSIDNLHQAQQRQQRVLQDMAAGAGTAVSNSRLVMHVLDHAEQSRE